MIKQLLKQVSLVMLCTVVAVGTAQAVDYTNASSVVDATHFFKGKKWPFQYLGTWADKESKAYKNVKKEISKLGSSYSNLAQKYKNDANKYKDSMMESMKGNATLLDVSEIKGEFSKDLRQKAYDIATGRELERLLNDDVLKAMQKELGEAAKHVDAVPTVDYANVTAGMFNLDSVFGSFEANKGVRDEDTRACSAMGVGGLAKGDSTGKECCKKWVEELNQQNNTSGRSGSAPTEAELMDLCCKLSPELCNSEAEDKAGCLKNQLSQGNSAEGSWKTCQIECGNKDYGELVYMEGTYNEETQTYETKYDEQQIDEMMKGCYGKDDWAPSPTVLTASELAPIVPGDAKNYVGSGSSKK